MNAPLPPSDALKHRAIRSFVIRAGRMTDAQTTAIDALMPKYGIAFAPQVLTRENALKNTSGADWVVEIGFGMGVTTAEIARARPDTQFIGIEVHPPGVGNVLKLIEAEKIENLRIIQHDAVEVLTTMIAENALDGVHIYFPDPWPKLRHHKRRLIQPNFVALLASRLRPGGYVHLATDWQPYAEVMLEVLSAEPALRNTAQGFAPKPDWRPLTKFENRGIKLGHGVWDLMFEKIALAAP
jgi:tRNA (guanine-N7-)-methyltransferase